MPLYGYQEPHCRRIIDTLARTGVCGDMSEMGTGKTAVALEAARHFDCVPLVVCPASVRSSWRRMSESFGVPAQVVSYQHAIRHLVKKTKVGARGSRLEWLAAPEMIIFDEAHNLKGEKSLQSKLAVAAKRQGVPRILLASATLIGEPTSLKAIGYLLGLHAMSDYYSFLLRHSCSEGPFGGIKFSQSPGRRAKAMEKITAAIAGKVHMLRRDEIPGFPKTKIETRLIDDEGDAAQALSEEIARLVAFRADQAAEAEEANLAMVEILRLRQMLELMKVGAIVDLAIAAQPFGGVCIFVNFSETIDAIRQELEAHGTVETIQGGQSERNRAEIVDRFQGNQTPFLILNIRAGGAGISLQDPTGGSERTSIICPNYSAIDLKQVLGRPHRIGGGYSVQHILLFDNRTERRVKKILDLRLTDLDNLTDKDLAP